MTYTKPHFGNLQKRAKALGFEVTRMSTDEDARAVGHHEYVLTPQGASDRTKENSRLHSLCGIRAIIEGKESKRSESSEKRVFTPEEIHKHQTVPVFRNSPFDHRAKAAEALESLKAARLIGAEQVFSAMDKALEPELMKTLLKSRIASLIGREVESLIEFSESERVSTIKFMESATDTHIVGKLVVMPETVLNDVLTLLNRISR